MRKPSSRRQALWASISFAHSDDSGPWIAMHSSRLPCAEDPWERRREGTISGGQYQGRRDWRRRRPCDDEAGGANRTFVSGHAQQIFFLGLTSFSSVCGDLDIEDKGCLIVFEAAVLSASLLLSSLFFSSLFSLLPLPLFSSTLASRPSNVSTGPAVAHGHHRREQHHPSEQGKQGKQGPGSAWLRRYGRVSTGHLPAGQKVLTLRPGPPRPRRRRRRCSGDGRPLCPRCPSLR